jgi:cation diffusion facilitator CzcD-associated flavoprotein CzcO
MKPSAAREPLESERAPHSDVAPRPVPHHRTVIVGAGFGGLGMAIRLLQGGERDFAVLEKAEEVGGTWRDNTYPGCQCDVASNIYSFSFAPNPNWSRTYAWQGEIFDYLKDCTERFGVRPFIRFGCELQHARWDNDAQRWQLRTSRGAFTAEVLVLGHGGLSAPTLPDIPGFERFKGTVFHSAAWRHDHDLSGERVAVIGTGASAIQVVPAIQPKVGKLTLFQRTAPFVIERVDPAHGKLRRALYKYLPFTQTFARFREYAGREMVVLGLLHHERMERFRPFALKHLRTQVQDPELRKKLTPRFTLGCKRILLSNDYYPALTQPNAEVVTERIVEATETGLMTADGTHHAFDTIVLCTGFKVTDHPVMTLLHGRDGRSLAEHWEKGAASYLGLSAAGFPNLFTLSGPNTALGHNSIIYMLESQFTYILDALTALRERDAAALEVKPEAVAAFCDEVQKKLEGTVWSSGCASWYMDANGRNTTIWPDFTFNYRKRTRKLDQGAYLFEARRAAQPVEHEQATDAAVRAAS